MSETDRNLVSGPTEVMTASNYNVTEAVFIDSGDEIADLVSSINLSVEHLAMADSWLVVRESGKMVGCMAMERRGLLVHIQSLSVAKGYRKRGIARAMVEHGFEHYVNGGEAMTALTLFWNIGFYEKLGFERVEPKGWKNLDDVTRREKHKFCTVMVKLKE